ncbi:MAG: hypothetical protein RBS39_09560 [Phycisphaerales bacterium]|jgi:hypothetical protein|nr:hypothetical protein [Phycisphaerales bacterium]
MTRMTLGAIAALMSASAAHADVTFTIVESGANVLVTGTGSFDLTGLTRTREAYNTGSIGNYTWPQFGGISVGVQTLVDVYDLVSGGYVPFDQTGAEPYGAGGQQGTSPFGDAVWGGDYFGLFITSSSSGGGPTLYDYGVFVPTGYQSGTVLDGSVEILDESFASLGMDIGTFVSHYDNNTVTIRVVPAPGGAAAFAFGGVLASRRRRR